MKPSGAGCQFNGEFAPAVLVLRFIRRLKSVPHPLSGVKSCEKAKTRSVLVVPVPSTFALTFQLLAVRPAAATWRESKVTTLLANVKSPWKPT